MHKNVLGFFIGGFSYPSHCALSRGERVKSAMRWRGYKYQLQKSWIPDRVGDDRKDKDQKQRHWIPD